MGYSVLVILVSILNCPRVIFVLGAGTVDALIFGDLIHMFSNYSSQNLAKVAANSRAFIT